MAQSGVGISSIRAFFLASFSEVCLRSKSVPRCGCPAIPLSLKEGEKEELETIAGSRTLPHR